MLREAIDRAISNLSPDTVSQQVFGPGAAYDFFVRLQELILSAKREIFIVDPYLNAEIFHGYLNSVQASPRIRLLLTKAETDLTVAAEKFALQKKLKVELRKSKAIHDRVIFLDRGECHVLGASIKDAAREKPTYIAPISPDIAKIKLKHYEDIWLAGNAI